MAGVLNGPIPTKLTLLADLDSFSPGTKVRFLGCVTAYCTKAGVLTLEHNYPPKNLTRAMVDVGLLLNSLAPNETQIGEWVNVMGYVRSSQNQQMRSPGSSGNRETKIQAIVLWSAKAFDLQGYERSLEQRKVSESIPLNHGLQIQ